MKTGVSACFHQSIMVVAFRNWKAILMQQKTEINLKFLFDIDLKFTNYILEKLIGT